jgi:hypothetical protein
MYLGKASFGSTYGAAGSLVIVLVWVYYSAQIFFFGAEFTQVYACEHGSERLCRRSDSDDTHDAKDSSKALKAESVKAVPAGYPRNATGGNGLLDVSAEPRGKAAGWLGAMLGAVLAGSKIRRVLKK